MSPARKFRPAWKVPSPLPKSTETPEQTLATARSCTPSPLKSPTATEEGLHPVPKFCASAKDTSCTWAAAVTKTLDTASPAQTNAILLFWVAIALPLCFQGVLRSDIQVNRAADNCRRRTGRNTLKQRNEAGAALYRLATRLT